MASIPAGFEFPAWPEEAAMALERGGNVKALLAAGLDHGVTEIIGIRGYFDTAVYKQLRSVMVDEDTTIQALLEEALDLLFQTRNRPMIARKNT
jgi:hypothetical protein